MPENIDLRGTQGAVVLPGGTITQHYSTPPETNIMMPGEHTQQEHTIEIALLKNEVAAHRTEIRDLWSAIRQMTGMRTIDAQTLFWVVVAIVGVTIGIIYAGGNWGQ